MRQAFAPASYCDAITQIKEGFLRKGKALFLLGDVSYNFVGATPCGCPISIRAGTGACPYHVKYKEEVQ
jgi:hypothetical protein